MSRSELSLAWRHHEATSPNARCMTALSLANWSTCWSIRSNRKLRKGRNDDGNEQKQPRKNFRISVESNKRSRRWNIPVVCNFKKTAPAQIEHFEKSERKKQRATKKKKQQKTNIVNYCAQNPRKPRKYRESTHYVVLHRRDNRRWPIDRPHIKRISIVLPGLAIKLIGRAMRCRIMCLLLIYGPVIFLLVFHFISKWIIDSWDFCLSGVEWCHIVFQQECDRIEPANWTILSSVFFNLICSHHLIVQHLHPETMR